MAKATVQPSYRNSQSLKALADSPESSQLISDLEATRWTGRLGYSIRSMTGIALLKSISRFQSGARAGTVPITTSHR